MRKAAVAAGASVSSSNKQTNGHGVSVNVIIAQSNFSIHTWPDRGYASADFYSCADGVQQWKAFDHLKEYLKAKKF